MRRLAFASLLFLGCFDWDVLSSTLNEPDLSVNDDLAMDDLAMADLRMTDLAMPDLRMPDLMPPPDLSLPVVVFTKQVDSSMLGGKKPNNALFGWNATNLTAVGDGGVVATTTNGTTWAIATTVGGGGTTQNLQDIWFSSDGSSGWFVGAGNTGYQWAGGNWSSNSAMLAGVVYGVFGTSNTKVVAGGDNNNNVFRFNTGWTKDNGSSFNTTINGVWGTGQNFYVVGAGSNDCLLLTDSSNGKVSCGTTGVLETVWGIDTSNVFAAGYENNTGVVVKYDGSKWQKQTIPSVGKLYSVWASGTKDIWVGGEKGLVLHLDASGWTQVTAMGIPNTEIVKDIWGADANNIWFLTDAGTIYKKN